MKVVILAGGYGTRISEYTDLIPKPMVMIGGKPLITHIMEIFSSYGHTDFYIALGYKSEVIKDFFLNYQSLNSDFTVNLQSGNINFHNKSKTNWNVTLIDTGLNSMTGGRVKRMQPYLNNEPFLLTYGDGVANVNINKLILHHQKMGKITTVTAVRPSARFGEMLVKDNLVHNFKEKPQTKTGWINGGFFVMEPKIFDYIDGDSTVLEKDPLEKLSLKGELSSFLHNGFWQCMDTKRDRDSLEEQWASGSPQWVIK